MTTMQIIPDRTAKNLHIADMTRALHDMYLKPISRIKRDKWRLSYQSPQFFSFTIYANHDSIKFYFTIPEQWQDFISDRLKTVWPCATTKHVRLPVLAPNSFNMAIHTKQHDFFSLATSKNNNDPLNSLLVILNDLKDGDEVVITVKATPADRQSWTYDATELHKQFRKGDSIRKLRPSVESVSRVALEVANDVMTEASQFFTSLVGMEPDKKPEVMHYDITGLGMSDNKVSDATKKKINEPVFNIEISVSVIADDINKGTMLLKTIAASYNDLADDNEIIYTLDPTPLSKRIGLYSSLLSASELSKFMQLPGSQLQQDFPKIEQIDTRETTIPTIMLNSAGIEIGVITQNGNDIPIYLPIDNEDELCLPTIVVGGMGCGKTRGYGGNILVNAAKKGFTSIGIDPAIGQLYEEACAGLPSEDIIHLKFGSKPLCLDWREVSHGTKSLARSRLASEIIAFIETASDDVGVQTMRYLRSAAKVVPTGRLNEVVELFTNVLYREKLLKTMADREIETWDTYNKMSDSRQTQIATPILNRLDVILGNDYLADCLECDEGIDFVDLIDKGVGKCIIIDIQKGDLGPEGVDVVAALIATKLDIAMVMRKTKHPVFIVQDEPHQYLKSARTWKSVAVESRKYRFAYTWMFHSWEQIPRSLAEIIKSAGPHYHVYKSSKKTYTDLAEELLPFTLTECLQTKTFYALNAIRAGGQNVPVFMARMSKPPTLCKATTK